ncbi:uncharacterized protein IWZ02DRAFT_456279 [Phyllosticta citriasiana]|uniref:Secreted protein n=1 Tax=Phyllosticta citriasiana TaxID=595635 RepID=A0ABR1KY37_9PEZI
MSLTLILKILAHLPVSVWARLGLLVRFSSLSADLALALTRRKPRRALKYSLHALGHHVLPKSSWHVHTSNSSNSIETVKQKEPTTKSTATSVASL